MNFFGKEYPTEKDRDLAHFLHKHFIALLGIATLTTINDKDRGLIIACAENLNNKAKELLKNEI